MGKLDYTLEQCLGKQVCVRVFNEEDHIDVNTEIWAISKPADYEALKEEINNLIETNMLDEYFIC